MLFRVASSPRFRAATRPRIRSSVRQAMWLVVLAAFVNCVWLLPTHADSSGRVLGANGGLALLAILVFLWLGSDRHLPAEIVLLAVLVAIDASIAAVIGIDVGVSLLCAGYVLLLPPLLALLVPWRTRFHLAWLILHIGAAAMLGALAPAGALEIDGPQTLLALLLVSSAGSVLGHIANLQARVLSFVLIERVRSMNRRARRDDLSMRQLNVRLEQMAWRDQLTGLGNRLALQRKLVEARNFIERFGGRYALLMLDLDHFKVINDTLGHFAGDDVLRRVASFIGAATRGTDAAFRFGGEEFVVLVAIEHDGEAAIVAERLRGAVERPRIAHPGNSPHGVVTVSIGATIVDRASLAAPDDDWLQRADAALYEAKRLGRNRAVVVSGPLRSGSRAA